MSGLLQVDPSTELRFKGPFNDVVPAELRLRNISGKPVCFKIKTTAPRQYCVRPNCGLIEPGDTAAISVVLQPIDPNTKEKIKHKFLILSMRAPDNVDNVEQLWKDPPTETIYDMKLRSVLIFPNEQQVAGKTESGTKHDNQKLYDENRKLKEEVDRLRKLMHDTSTEHVQSPPRRPVSSPPNPGIGYFAAVVMAILAIICGLLFGKFVV